MGAGISAGVGASTKISTASFCSGDEVTGGLTGSLGDILFGKGTVLTDGNDTSITATLGLGGGVAGAGADRKSVV